jgi:hypothetical protein
MQCCVSASAGVTASAAAQQHHRLQRVQPFKRQHCVAAVCYAAGQAAVVDSAAGVRSTAGLGGGDSVAAASNGSGCWLLLLQHTRSSCLLFSVLRCALVGCCSVRCCHRRRSSSSGSSYGSSRSTGTVTKVQGRRGYQGPGTGTAAAVLMGVAACSLLAAGAQWVVLKMRPQHSSNGCRQQRRQSACSQLQQLSILRL